MTTEKAAVRPNVPTQRIVVQDERLIEMNVGDTRDLKVTAIPLLVSNKKTLSPSEAETAALLSALVTDKLEWSSSDGEIATVDENGTVCALREGSAKITVKSGEHEVIFNVLVEVAIPDWASEEFIEYIERIGAYTELPLGTDGSAGPTAQYVTFGFERQNGEIYHYTERGTIDERTETNYNGYSYCKGDDDEWYYAWDMNCYDDTHDHSDLLLKSEIRNRYKYEIDEETGDIKRIPYEEYEYTYPPLIAKKIHPRKWRLLDREKGLMVMENYDPNMYELLNNSFQFSLFCHNPYGDEFHYAYYNKNDIESIAAICNYETSYVRAWLDGGEYLECFNFSEMEDGKFKTDRNGKYIYGGTQVRMFRMNERRIWTDDQGRYRNYDAYTNSGNNFQKFFAPGQLSQIKEVDLDCGEGGSVKGRLFILSEDEIKQYYYNSNTPVRDSNRYVYDGMTYWTRTRKKVNGKNTLCGFRLNSDGTVKEFVQFDGYDTGAYRYFIPAICVAPAPHR